MTEGELRSRVAIDPVTGCWEWQGAYQRSRAGSPQPVFGATAVRGMAYEAMIGERLEDLDISVTCANPKCVAPDHLNATAEPVTMLRAQGKACEVKLARETCKHGHVWADVGWYLNSHKARVCKECHRFRMAKRRSMALEEAA